MCVYKKNQSQIDNAEKNIKYTHRVIYCVHDSTFMNQEDLDNVVSSVCVYISHRHINNLELISDQEPW